jgi:hypothetical protein
MGIRKTKTSRKPAIRVRGRRRRSGIAGKAAKSGNTGANKSKRRAEKRAGNNSKAHQSTTALESGLQADLLYGVVNLVEI